jgi:O-antigen ligase
MTAIPPLLMVRQPARVLEVALNIVALAFLPILVMAPHGVAPLIAFAGVFALGLAWPIDEVALLRYRGVAVLALLLILWGASSALWAVEPTRSLLIAARLTGLFAAGFALVFAAERIVAPWRLIVCALLGLGIALVLAEIQFSTDGLLTTPFFIRPFVAPKLNQAVNAVAILVLPLAVTLILLRRVWLGLLVAAVVTATIYHLVGTAAKVAFTAAAVFALLFYLWGRRLAYAAAILSVLVILTAPLSFPRLIQVATLVEHAQEMKFSAIHRLLIWSFVGARIEERPVLGWGLDSSRAIPGGSIEIHPGAPWLPLHPHNSALQVWLELGMSGAALFAAFIILMWRVLARATWPPLFQAAVGGSLLMTFVASFGTYGIWQEWWIATMWLALFLILLMGRLVTQERADVAALKP